ncbi:MAG: hypothetical protein AAFQ89_01370 [Cyanobacteria bacterium J06626_18]
MNTPSHSILNLAILGRAQQTALTWPILIGSWLPDAALFVFYVWAKIAGFTERAIWSDLYYSPFWQDVFAIGNSMPLALLGCGVAIWQKWPRVAVLCASMLLHHAEDLPFHNEDAHRHFWPLTDFRFVSPMSYWDRDHMGAYGALIELVLVLLSSLILLRWVRSPWGRGSLVLTNVVYAVGYVGFYLLLGRIS